MRRLIAGKPSQGKRRSNYNRLWAGLTGWLEVGIDAGYSVARSYYPAPRFYASIIFLLNNYFRTAGDYYFIQYKCFSGNVVPSSGGLLYAALTEKTVWPSGLQ
jgi:hypothetical protein